MHRLEVGREKTSFGVGRENASFGVKCLERQVSSNENGYQRLLVL